MPSAENVVVIGVPIAEVFAFIADGTNNPQWRPGVIDITPPEGGPGEGAVYGQGLRGPKGQRMEGDYRITEYDPPNRLAFAVTAGPVKPTGVFELDEPVPGATTVRFTLDLQAKGLWRVPMKFGGGVVEKQMQAETRCLFRLKDVLEGEPEPFELDEVEAEQGGEAEAGPQ